MGQSLIISGFIASIISAALYLAAFRGKRNYIKPARIFFHLSVIATVSTSAYLLYLIMTHQFQYTYVWDYSSSDLPLNLLLSTFYAGQEGSFLLWAFLMAIQGLFLVSYLIKRDNQSKGLNNKEDLYEPSVMFLYVLISSFLLFILIIKSPFMYVWESFPGEVNPGFIPEEGRGLNPLLQNFWMTIHPPILFAGFAALSIPFCFALTALLKNEYSRWMKLALPWTLYGGMILGIGIILGGYWAYGVLGWGGYWAWDPVENSSLVPWILIIAAIHTMSAEEKTGKFRKTSLVLSILSFTMVLYSTFLTRSGILGDASVHSFVDPGQEVYLFLVIFLVLFGAGGIGLIFFRLNSLRTPESESSNILSRESALYTGALILCAVSLVIAAGTSWPILSKGTVDMQFYNKMNLPLAIMTAVMNGISLLFAWKNTDRNRFLKSLIIPASVSIVLTIMISFFAAPEILITLFIAVSIFSLIINLNIAFKIFRKNKTKIGAYIAHAGIMLLFLGIIGSSKYSEEENVSLPINEPKEALGYTLTYKGSTPMTDDKEKFNFNVMIEKDGKELLLQPVMYYSEYSKGVMKNPDIANFILKDVYLSPMSLESSESHNHDKAVTLKKGEVKEIKGMTVTFTDFDRTHFSNQGASQTGENIIGAEVEVESEYGKEKFVLLQKITESGIEPLPFSMKSSDRYTFFLEKINIGAETSIEISVIDKAVENMKETPETLILTASIKPFINLVWAGTVVMAIGFIFSFYSRYKNFRSSAKFTGREKILKPSHSKNGHHKKRLEESVK